MVALGAAGTGLLLPRRGDGQDRPLGTAPVTPAGMLGPVVQAPTLSLLGVAPVAAGSPSLTHDSDVWVGASHPMGRLGPVSFATVGTGRWQAPAGTGAATDAHGQLAVRARAQVGGARVWSAVGYGMARGNGGSPTDLLGMGRGALGGINADGADTTISRRVDLGALARAEAGVLTRARGFEIAVGFAVERATRVTTQTLTIDAPEQAQFFTGASPERMVSTQTLRTLQRRDLATAMGSLGFTTHRTTWLVSVTAPVAKWVSSDALAPTPRPVPTVAAITMVQPVTQWLSLVAAAASSPVTVGGTVLRDDVTDGRRGLAPVVAVGVRVARLPVGRRADAPSGILGFETRTLGTVDAATLTDGAPLAVAGDSVRVILLVDAPRAESVELMGDATQWLARGLQRLPSGRWRAELALPRGIHRVMVRADLGQWVAPPGLPLGADDFGTPVGMLVIGGRR
ncbi:MAG: glycogen-binding domain-containing protein [Gemmatimonadetes bacterium]|nr:glycogen-binding domain-containing protein [Gemmatimonadota bacterium]